MPLICIVNGQDRCDSVRSQICSQILLPCYLIERVVQHGSHAPPPLLTHIAVHLYLTTLVVKVTRTIVSKSKWLKSGFTDAIWFRMFSLCKLNIPFAMRLFHEVYHNMWMRYFSVFLFCNIDFVLFNELYGIKIQNFKVHHHNLNNLSLHIWSEFHWCFNWLKINEPYSVLDVH